MISSGELSGSENSENVAVEDNYQFHNSDVCPSVECISYQSGLHFIWAALLIVYGQHCSTVNMIERLRCFSTKNKSAAAAVDIFSMSNFEA